MKIRIPRNQILRRSFGALEACGPSNLGFAPKATARGCSAADHSCYYMDERTSHRKHARPGAASIVAIAVLVILAGIMAQQTRRVVMERRQMRNEVAYLQAEKLAEAGMLLAQTSKTKDPAWSGTTWNLQPGSIHQTNSAEVVITVQEELCTVVARYPTNAEIPFQVTRTRKLAP